MDHKAIGADANPAQRPGVPMERNPAPAGAAHWAKPERQADKRGVTRRAELDQLTPVFGTAQPPKGFAGSIRKLAYRIPEHKARHWMLLLLADRVEVGTLRLKKLLTIAIPLTALAWWLRNREA